jgi:hypothetical protein
MNMSGESSKYFIKGRKDIVTELLNIRYARSTPIPKQMLFNIINQTKATQRKCIPTGTKTNSILKGW